MSIGHDANLDRLWDLLADRSTQCLSAAESAELIALLASRPDVDEHAFDRVAAALDLTAMAAEYEPLPASVRAKVDAGATAWLAQRKGLRLAEPGATESDAAAQAPVITPPRTRSSRSWLPWLVAAACLAVAAVSWWPSGGPQPLTAQRDALLVRPGTQTVAWAENEAGVTGDVVWNDRQQTGFMRISGLDVNDPSVYQYQLWIFDEARRAYSDDVAVDGGVFDIDRATGDVLVPIRSPLPVTKPFLFAVTTEPPGGVVKHNPDRDPDRYRIILTAPI
ncbi:MAG: anti-sigma factor domain-containing protein [Planctomycetota bacterium]|jgi:surface antigen